MWKTKTLHCAVWLFQIKTHVRAGNKDVWPRLRVTKDVIPEKGCCYVLVYCSWSSNATAYGNCFSFQLHLCIHKTTWVSILSPSRLFVQSLIHFWCIVLYSLVTITNGTCVIEPLTHRCTHCDFWRARWYSDETKGRILGVTSETKMSNFEVLSLTKAQQD